MTPANNEIYLMVPQKNGGGKANKRKKLNADKKFAKGRSHIVSVSDEQKVCVKALECLSYLLVYQGAVMKPVLFYIMQEKIVSVGFAIASNIQQDGDLYRDPHCRSRLCDLVGFMMTHPVQKMPVPLNYGIAMLTKLKQSDPDSNVREAASMSLVKAETTIHSRKDVFYFPPEYRDLRETLLFNKQTIHKFNEATNSRQDVNGPEIVITEDEVPTIVEEKDNEDIVISDNESVELITKAEKVKSDEFIKEQLEINEISDDEEKESSEEDVIMVSETPTSVVLEPPKPVATPEKRSTRSTVTSTVAKKPKVSNKDDDALLQEYLADFDDEIV